MDPNAALRRIDGAKRIDAETRETMGSLFSWITRGGFAPDWKLYPRGAKRMAKMFGKLRGMGETYWTHVH
jgi:hypothetical protein